MYYCKFHRCSTTPHHGNPEIYFLDLDSLALNINYTSTIMIYVLMSNQPLRNNSINYLVLLTNLIRTQRVI